MSDRSLDEFGAGPGDEAVDDEDGSDPDPARATMRWSPDGGDCVACGATVARRWRDGEGFVCADCKEW
ncbi:DUF7573 domain-containing protein [Haloplanus halophilus]|uniref:DUF7573 domain-containing protein n=1 Tax=Haloplanus halophilus TaxID=2949993 RepID=UPI00203F0A8C|nr:hypothetical protein [Haloplanus sp. GDY1]